jgi:phage tail-like protein
VREPKGVLLAALPAIFRAFDEEGGQLGALLGVFERILLDSGGGDRRAIAEQIDAIVEYLAPMRVEPSMAFHPKADIEREGDRHVSTLGRSGAPDRFLPWLAQWVAFTPYPHVSTERLRHVVARIVPLYGSRGTRDYLQQLIILCFDEIGHVTIDENPFRGLRVGAARLGEDSRLNIDEPFHFRVEVALRAATPNEAQAQWRTLEARVRAVVEFAKPAQTAYELVLRRGPPNAEETADA